ncbi:MAG: hypothetical protein E6I54_02440 [Chloroflexi bacterium]|nr:MAG: hypothetical protein E6I54_02440 [Chloroflexota bacterium]
MGFIGRLFRRGDDEPPEPGLLLPGSAPRFLPAGEERIFREIRTLPATDPRTGKRVFRSGVGISAMSAADARQIAEEQARRALEDLLAGRSGALDGYAYLANRRAEALVDVLRGPTGESARITVNAYGSIVMNATAALFADVDTEDVGPEPRAEPPPASPLTVLAAVPTSRCAPTGLGRVGASSAPTAFSIQRMRTRVHSWPSSAPTRNTFCCAVRSARSAPG